MTCAYRRSDGDETLVVCLNAGDEPARLSLVVPEIDGRTLRPGDLARLDVGGGGTGHRPTAAG